MAEQDLEVSASYSVDSSSTSTTPPPVVFAATISCSGPLTLRQLVHWIGIEKGSPVVDVR